MLVNTVTKQIQSSGYEYADFKLTFSISIKSPMYRFYILAQAEQHCKDEFRHFEKKSMRSNLDFKEVFKWIISPLLAKKLEVPANLDGSFLANCVFFD